MLVTSSSMDKLEESIINREPNGNEESLRGCRYWGGSKVSCTVIPFCCTYVAISGARERSRRPSCMSMRSARRSWSVARGKTQYALRQLMVLKKQAQDEGLLGARIEPRLKWCLLAYELKTISRGLLIATKSETVSGRVLDSVLRKTRTSRMMRETWVFDMTRAIAESNVLPASTGTKE